MAYLGNDLQVAYQSYQIIDDISGSFNGVLTSFALQVGGVTPVPFPINPQQCLISVNGVIQEPDPSGTSGFNLVGSNIVFASAPTGGHTFFGVILAGADYVNVGVNYPSGSVSAPSITFDTDLDTGIYNPAANELGLVTNSSDALRIDSSGNVGLGTSAPDDLLHLSADNTLIGSDWSLAKNLIRIEDKDTSQAIGQVSGGIVFEGNDSNAGAAGVQAVITANANSSSGGGQLRFYTAATSTTLSGSEDPRFIIDGDGRLLVGTSSALDTSAGRLLQVADANGAFLVLGRDDTTVGDGPSLGGIHFYGNDTTSNAWTKLGAIDCSSDGIQGPGDNPTKLVFSTTADGASSPTEAMRIDRNGNLFCVGVYSATTASAANVRVSSSGQLERSTSSAKYKTNIETIEDQYSNALLNCRPVWYRSTTGNDNPEHSWWGFIAEEVAEIDPRLVHWKTIEVTYDENGSVIQTPCDPEPEGVAYDRFVPHLLNLIKRQGEAIAELQAEVAALKGA